MEGGVIDFPLLGITVTGWKTDSQGYRYVKVKDALGVSRHYPQAWGVPPSIVDPDRDYSNDCMFLEGEACYIY